MSTRTVDALVVGAGPVGLTTALLLAREDATVEIWERWPVPYALPRAVALAHEPLRVLRTVGLDPDLPNLLEPWGIHGQRFYFEDAAGDLLLESTNELTSASGGPEMYAFAQPDLERELEHLASEHPNITIKRGMSLAHFDDDGSAVTAIGEAHDGLVTVPDGGRDTVRALYLVGCDGAKSTVGAQLGVEFHDRGFDHDWFVVDVVPKDLSAFRRDGIQHLDPARPTTLISGGPGRFRWEFMVLPADDGKDFSDPRLAWDLLAPWGVTPAVGTVERQARYSFSARTALEWRRGRVFLAGDAAHQTPPFLGQGLNGGVRDAANLAWRLSVALNSAGPDQPERLLAAYSPERRTQFEQILDVTVMLGELICTTDVAAARARDERLRRRSGEIRRSQADWPVGPGTHRFADPGASTLSRHGIVSDGTRTGRFDDLVGTGHVLIGTDAAAFGALDDHTRDLWMAHGGRIAHFGDGGLRDTGDVYRPWLRELGVSAVLVRPDFYVYGSAIRPDDAPALIEDFLAEFLTRPSKED